MATTKATEENGTREGTPLPGEGGKKFGMMSGVFVPTLLTILGVIMYLREGWVVGQLGLGGAIGVILLAFLISGCTALSMASVTTNIRIGAGGAYSIISQSLGIEIGGAIGIPLFLSQTLAVVMYIFGFRAGWVWIFPDHPAILVDLATFVLLVGIAFLSASVAFRIQYVILAVIVASLAAIAIAAARGSMQVEITWFARPEAGQNFWLVFAVFFPAATGIMAGANMSGDLKDPRRSIPVGTLSAVAVSLVVYLLLAWWLAASAPMEELRDNYTVMVDRAAWGPAVLAGLLGATFSSALSSLVGAPRIAQKKSAKGEPRRGLYVAAVIILAALMLRDLNAVAPLITMFFLITYAMLNIVVFIEQRVGLITFRPLFAIPRWVAPIGAAGCFAAMFIVNPPFGLAAVVVVVIFYAVLIRRHLQAPYGDIRSSVFTSLAEWSARKVSRLPESGSRGWKANILVPVEHPEHLRGEFRLLHGLVYPNGTVHVVAVDTSDDPDHIKAYDRQCKWLAAAFRKEDVFAAATALHARQVQTTVENAMDILNDTFFRPSVLFLSIGGRDAAQRDGDVENMVRTAAARGLGVLLFCEHPEAGLGRQAVVEIRVPRPAGGWEWTENLSGLNLAVLAGYKLQHNWDAELRLEAEVTSGGRDEARDYLHRLKDLARLGDAKVVVSAADRQTRPPAADLVCIAGDGEQLDLSAIRAQTERIGVSLMVAWSSGPANALA